MTDSDLPNHPPVPHAPATRLVGAGRRAEWTSDPRLGGGVVNVPVWRASTILQPDVATLERRESGDTHDKFYYGRRGTPTVWALADALTGMEPGGAGTLLYPSGVAAIACAMLALLGPGDRVLIVDSAYGPTRSLADGLLKRLGVTTTFYDPMIGAGIADLIDDHTRLIILESPGSLTFEVQDIPAITAVARARGVVTLLDNTWATPLLFPALSHGVDISMMSLTKYVGGHSDAMMGSLTATEALWPTLRDAAYQLGQSVSPDDCALLLRGLRTLDVRMARHAASALAVAQWLAAHPAVGTVFHPALPSCPGHENWVRDFNGASGLFAFTLKLPETDSHVGLPTGTATPGAAGRSDSHVGLPTGTATPGAAGKKLRAAVIDALTLFGIGYSWGGYESLVVPADPGRTAMRWTADGPLIRLSIGLEDPADLIADLDQALARFG